MSQTETVAFRRMCRQFRWLAMFMVISVGAVLAAGLIFVPMKFKLGLLLSNLPAFCYLFGVWAIGRALGEVSKGSSIQAALPGVMRKVGVALGVGGVISVFVVSNLMRLVGHGKGGYLNFDVAGMTLGMIGGAVFLLGRVMDQAVAAQAELDEMI